MKQDVPISNPVEHTIQERDNYRGNKIIQKFDADNTLRRQYVG